MHISGLESIDASANGGPSFIVQTSQTFESSHAALGFSISKLPSPPCIASCNFGTVLLRIGLGIDEEGGSRGV